MPNSALTAIEINESAAVALDAIPDCTPVIKSILDYEVENQFEFVFTSGVLIHINPEHLLQVYQLMAAASSRFVMMAEYYNPTPMTIPYRGHDDRLFKRDFAGEFMDSNSDFDLVDCGFDYHRAVFPADDTTWFLMERRSS
mgnify:FL=1